MKPGALASLLILAACDSAPAGNGASTAPPQGAARRPQAVEIAAASLPADEQIAGALDHEILRGIAAMESTGAIVEPDMMRSVVRNVHCRFASARRSRAECRYEYHRSPDNDRSFAEAVKWVTWLTDWQARSGAFVHVREPPAAAGLPDRVEWRVADAGAP